MFYFVPWLQQKWDFIYKPEPCIFPNVLTLETVAVGGGGILVISNHFTSFFQHNIFYHGDWFYPCSLTFVACYFSAVLLEVFCYSSETLDDQVYCPLEVISQGRISVLVIQQWVFYAFTEMILRRRKLFPRYSFLFLWYLIPFWSPYIHAGKATSVQFLYIRTDTEPQF